MLYGRRRPGACLNGELISVSRVDALSDSLVATGTVPGFKQLGDVAFRYMRLLYDNCQDLRRSGCASLDLCHVAGGAAGRLHRAAAAALGLRRGGHHRLRGGGLATTMAGEPLPLTHSSAVLATNSRLHAQLTGLLA